MHTLNIRGKVYKLKHPWIMGILNITSDSFYDGGRYLQKDLALKWALEMEKDGATIIDVGGYSSRPGAVDISVQEELDRVLPIIEAIRKESPVLISLDTFRSEVARNGFDAGADMINDIAAGEDDPDMIRTVAELGIPYIAMHKKGKPRTMHLDPSYDSVHLEVLDYLNKKKKECLEAGVNDVILDPGFGFGKSIAHNFELLANLHIFKQLRSPILVGISRKSMIYKTLNQGPDEALVGTQFLHALVLQSGASMLRVHDVKATRDVIKLWTRYSDFL